MKVFIYDTEKNRLSAYNRSLNDAMPYIQNRYLTVKEFRGKSKSNILWTTKQAMEAFNITRQRWKKPIYVGYAFRRIYEGGHGYQSQHYAGVSFDVAQTASVSDRKKLNQLATKLGVWRYVEPISMTPTWVHFDRRYGKSACSAGFPTLGYGSQGVYVFILQDALNTLGYKTGGLDGKFYTQTQQALANYQRNNGLNVSYVSDCATWQSITKRVKGMGKTSTTI